MLNSYVRSSSTSKIKESMNNNRSRELPDAIYGQILSLADIKSAVRGMVLSKRWKDLVWGLITNVHLDGSNFSKVSKFSNYSSEVLKRLDKTSAMDKFIFRSKKRLNKKFITDLTDYLASVKGLKQLQLCMLKGNFDQIIFINKIIPDSLTKLELKVENWKNQSPSTVIDVVFGLPRLEVLHLEGFRFAEQSNILSKSRNLVELSMINCTLQFTPGKFHYELILCATQLVKLTIFDFHFPSQNRAILLTLPNLSAFSFRASDAIPVIQTDEFLHLETASLELSDRGRIGKQELVIGMLQKLCRAQDVTLSLPVFELLCPNRGIVGEEVPKLPFSSLNILRITGDEENMRRPNKHTIDKALNTISQQSFNLKIITDLTSSSKRTKRQRI